MRAKYSAKSLASNGAPCFCRNATISPRDVALVEAIARRDDAGGASARFRGALGVDHAAQRARESPAA